MSRSGHLIACLLALTLLGPAAPSAQTTAKPSASPKASAAPKPSASPRASASPAAKPSASASASPKASAAPKAATTPKASATPKTDPILANGPDGLYVLFDTPKGKILAALDLQRSPMTVTAFVGLAEGTIKASNRSGPFYDGLNFHRVVSKAAGSDSDFMIQGGDPEGTGQGGPGFTFPDELDPALEFSAPGMLAMANSGADSNGSQFFITLDTAHWLDQMHTIFGQVVSGLDVAARIQPGDAITKVTILRKGKTAEAFRADPSNFDLLEKSAVERNARKNTDAIARLLPNAQKSANGLSYVIDKAGSGSPALAGQTVSMYYTGSFLSGRVFDSNLQSGQPAMVKVGTGKIIPGWDQTLMEMKPGEKRRVLLPPDQAFGANGVENVIPPNAWLLLDIELVSVGN